MVMGITMSGVLWAGTWILMWFMCSSSMNRVKAGVSFFVPTRVLCLLDAVHSARISVLDSQYSC